MCTTSVYSTLSVLLLFKPNTDSYCISCWTFIYVIIFACKYFISSSLLWNRAWCSIVTLIVSLVSFLLWFKNENTRWILFDIYFSFRFYLPVWSGHSKLKVYNAKSKRVNWENTQLFVKIIIEINLTSFSILCVHRHLCVLNVCRVPCEMHIYIFGWKYIQFRL